MTDYTIFFHGYGISQANTEIVLTADGQQLYQGPVWSVAPHIEPAASQINDNPLYALDMQSDSPNWEQQISIRVTNGDLYLLRHTAVISTPEGDTVLPQLYGEWHQGVFTPAEPKTDVRIDGIPQQVNAVDPEQARSEWAWKVPAGSTITYTLRANDPDPKPPIWDITLSYLEDDLVTLPGVPGIEYDALELEVVEIPVSSITNNNLVEEIEVAKFVDAITSNASSPLLSPLLVRSTGDGYTLLTGADQFVARVQLGATTVQAKVVPAEMLSTSNVRRAVKAVPAGADIDDAEYWE